MTTRREFLAFGAAAIAASQLPPFQQTAAFVGKDFGSGQSFGARARLYFSEDRINWREVGSAPFIEGGTSVTLKHPITKCGELKCCIEPDPKGATFTSEITFYNPPGT